MDDAQDERFCEEVERQKEELRGESCEELAAKRASLQVTLSRVNVLNLPDGGRKLRAYLKAVEELQEERVAHPELRRSPFPEDWPACAAPPPPAPPLAPPLHPLLEPLRALLGTWKGNGVGGFPTLASTFAYTEEASFEAVHPSKPVLAYSHRTARADNGAPMHRESGFLKALPGGKVSWTVAQVTGMAEVAEGSFDEEKGELRTLSRELAGAEKVTQVARCYTLSADKRALSYTVSMATKAVPELTQHLTAMLQKAG
jgi:THAP domain-containing protein 4